MYQLPIRRLAQLTALAMFTLLFCLSGGADAQNLETPAGVVHQVSSPNERMEMTVNDSRMLRLDKKIPRAQVNNREILELTPLSPNEVQVFAKRSGVTQINLWDETGKLHSIDVLVTGDARELQTILISQFPHSNIKVTPLANSVVLSGYLERIDQVDQITRIAEDYFPKVINNMQVGGVQQVLLHTKVVEVSRTKARGLGMDWAISSGDSLFSSSAAGLLAIGSDGAGGAIGTVTANSPSVFAGVTAGSGLQVYLDALSKSEVAKTLAEPTLVTVSGRAAYFHSGGEIPYQTVVDALSGPRIDYKPYGTRVDFVPIVLGNGIIRLEVRPEVSEINRKDLAEFGSSLGAVPLSIRQVDTAVEMRAGQTFAIAGIIYTRSNTVRSGLPWLSDLPYLGVPFRRVRDEVEEIELLILVTPELVEPLDKHEVPQCLPGDSSTNPGDKDLYLRGHIEVPAPGPCGPGGSCNESCSPGAPCGASHHRMNHGVLPQGSMQYESLPTPAYSQPVLDSANRSKPVNPAQSGASGGVATKVPVQGTSPKGTVQRAQTAQSPSASGGNGLIGPIGYDVSRQ